jgi:Helicase conserved C-terminal domain
MPNFVESLQGKDLGHLKIVAQMWAVELHDQEIQAAILDLKNSLVSAPAIDRMVSKLSPGVKSALDDLCLHSGRLPWAQFCRAYGEVREIGSAKRDREHPYENPASATEALWYLGLVARAFFDTSAGPVEFAYIPDDILALLPGYPAKSSVMLGRPASTVEYSEIFPVNDNILDYSCSCLAAIRVGFGLPRVIFSEVGEEPTEAAMQALLAAAGLVDATGQTHAEPVRKFLEARRGEALLLLFSAWKNSDLINELRQLPEILIEGKWENDSLRTRQMMIEWFSTIPADTWWNLNSFISSVKARTPDYQRPAGDYDSWFIKSKINGEYLRGFEHWDEVDGRLISYLVTGPLHWLGVIDLACVKEGQEITAFRLSRWSKALLNGEAPRGLAIEKEPLVVRSDARVGARKLTPRSVRYQIARFCDWEKETPEEYQYRISPSSLVRAQQQGLSVSQLIKLLNTSTKAIPPSLIKAVERWDKQGSEARLENMLVLRVSSEEILQALRKSRASRFLGEPLGPAVVAVKPGALEKVLGALAELGYLGEVRGEPKDR